jgi:hypothetical protein
MKAYRCTVLLLMFFGIPGCAGQENREKIAIVPVNPPPPYTRTDLNELLRFAAEFAELSPSARVAECRHLRQLQQTESSLGARLRLLVARSPAGACAGIGESTAITEAALAEANDESLKSFLIYHKTLLARFAREVERRKLLEKRIAQARASDLKAARRLQLQERELQILQKKLEALKVIEQGLGEPNDGH